MISVEKRFLEWIEKHILLLAGIAATLIAIGIRYSYREIISIDASECLLPWYQIIKENGGIEALSAQVGNYNMLYQFLIALFTYLPIEPLSAYKLLSCIFDFLLAGAMGLFIYDYSEKDKALKGILVYMAVLFSPMVFLNSSYWGQCDAIYTFFCIASLMASFKEKYKMTFFLFGMAFAFKLQAVFLLPFFCILYFMKKRFSILHFGIIPATMVAASLPCIFMGRKVSEVFTIYFEQTDYYKQIALNYPTFWNLFQNEFWDDFYLNMKKPAIAITIVILATFMLVWSRKKVELSSRNIIFMAFVLTYTCVLFLPSMHERYGFLYEILAIWILFLERKTLPCMLAMYITSFATYGIFLFRYESNMTILSIVNVLAYVGYICILSRELLKEERPLETCESVK